MYFNVVQYVDMYIYFLKKPFQLCIFAREQISDLSQINSRLYFCGCQFLIKQISFAAQVMDRLFPIVYPLLSNSGCFYLVTVAENKPGIVLQFFLQPFTPRRGGGEVLPYMCYIWVCAAVKGMVFKQVGYRNQRIFQETDQLLD